MIKRQLINMATMPSMSSTSSSSCMAIVLPSSGLITLNSSMKISLNSDALYQPVCNESSDVIISESGIANHIHFQDPFYASILPGCFALAGATVIAYLLLIIILITQERFLHRGVLILGRRGFTNVPSSSEAGIGIGGRPWLQEVAVLTVAISLTIATTNMFKVAEAQYMVGYMDARALQKILEDGLGLKIIRVISNTFLWLAQTQTLIRLFPRHREKIIIKWTAFALITLDGLFSILNVFAYQGPSRPRSFVDAVPALAYLFQLALSLLYAAWVIYYSITKRKFAFYHPYMKNICLVALLSLLSVLVPVVFFVTDISQPDLASWGDYVRWVGAAAASVVVWEWVERIEDLERNEKKDGVLGREVFDGDEMLDFNPSTGLPRKARLAKFNKPNSKIGGNICDPNGISSEKRWPLVWDVFNRLRTQNRHDIESGNSSSQTKYQTSRLPLLPTRPSPVATSPIRAEAQITKRVIGSISHSSTKPTQSTDIPGPSCTKSGSKEIPKELNSFEAVNCELDNVVEDLMNQNTNSLNPRHNSCISLTRKNNPVFKEGDCLEELSDHRKSYHEPTKGQSTSFRWELPTRLEDPTFAQLGRSRLSKSRHSVSTGILPKTIIPAPPRRLNFPVSSDELEEAERNVATQINSYSWAPSSNTQVNRTSISKLNGKNKQHDLK